MASNMRALQYLPKPANEHLASSEEGGEILAASTADVPSTAPRPYSRGQMPPDNVRYAGLRLAAYSCMGFDKTVG